MATRSLAELLSDDPAMPLIREWIATARNRVEVLPPSPRRARTLVDIQVTTRSPLGAIAYETGGLLIDGGWLRILGSGHARLSRTLSDWNAGREQFYLVADDAIGGFYALNGGAVGPDVGKIYYLAPDTLGWESFDRGYGDFLSWALQSDLNEYYATLRWSGWETDVAALDGDHCFLTLPPLFTREGRGPRAKRHAIPVTEAWGLAMSFRAQIGPPPDEAPPA